MKPHFKTPLDVRVLRDGYYILIDALVFQSELMGRVEVPAGFHTDFATVPRIPFIFDLFGGRGDKAAALHDHLYRHEGEPRKFADYVFLEAMLADGQAPWRSYAMYAALRVFGGLYYRRPRGPR